MSNLIVKISKNLKNFKLNLLLFNSLNICLSLPTKIFAT